MSGLPANIPNEIVIAEICRKTGWTYQEFLNQPDWLVDTMLMMDRTEAKVAKSNQKGYNNSNDN